MNRNPGAVSTLNAQTVCSTHHFPLGDPGVRERHEVPGLGQDGPGHLVPESNTPSGISGVASKWHQSRLGEAAQPTVPLGPFEPQQESWLQGIETANI